RWCTHGSHRLQGLHESLEGIGGRPRRESSVHRVRGEASCPCCTRRRVDREPGAAEKIRDEIAYFASIHRSERSSELPSDQHQRPCTPPGTRTLNPRIKSP